MALLAQDEPDKPRLAKSLVSSPAWKKCDAVGFIESFLAKGAIATRYRELLWTKTSSVSTWRGLETYSFIE
jgi:hypothetical protein